MTNFEKLKLQTPNQTENNIEKIAKIFPNVITEIKDEKGNTKKGIDFDLLKQNLSEILVEDENERYRLDWPGKKKSLLKANTPINKTLRPCVEESVDFENTENLYIEGDNFEVLKILQESYLGKVKMIYIDPPYNTGKDFIYKDNFKASKEDYEEEIGTKDEEGGKLFKNTDTNGRFHSDWLSMMYERLLVARDLLKDDGVIFISIDDNEQANLKRICDEVFGEENFITNICHKSRASISNDKIISQNHNLILLYGKEGQIIFENRKQFGLPIDKSGFNLSDKKGCFKLVPVSAPGGSRKGNPFFEFQGISGYFRFSKNTMQSMFKDGLIVKKGDTLQQKYYLEKALKSRKTVTTWWDEKFYTSSATAKLKKILLGDFFTNPKPVSLLGKILAIINDKNSLVLDFFSGSATTAHAVMQLNAEDGGNRKFIMVQLPEETDEKSEAYKAGYKTIAEIGKERIRRAGEKIVNDELLIVNERKGKKGSSQQNLDLSKPDEDNSQLTTHNSRLDIGFRVYKVDSSNMKDVFYHPSELNQQDLLELESNIKDDRTPEDLLTQVILDLGLELSLPIKKKDILGNSVFFVQENALVACFDSEINFEIVDKIADCNPLKVVFRDSCFKDDKDRINVEERFKRLSPETVVNVI